MEFFDSHAHYNDEKYDEDRKEILEKIYKEGITKIVSAGYNVESSKIARYLSGEYEYICYTSGISPNDIPDNNLDIELQEIIKIAQDKKNVAIGEIGLDYYWNKKNKQIQKDIFIRQINIANQLNLPIVVHTREAVIDTIEILKNNIVNKKGIMHCCPLNRELVKEMLKLEYYISFAGPITFKNSKNAEEIIKIVPLSIIF